MINKYFDGKILSYNGKPNEYDEEVEQFVTGQISVIENKFDTVHVAEAMNEIWKIISRSNKYIDETAPWTLFKNCDNTEKLQSVMYHLLENIRKVAILIKPFMPDISEQILDSFNISDEFRTWESIKKYDVLSDIQVVEKIEPLFARLDIKKELENQNQ